MNKFISEMCATMGISNVQSLNCCCCQGTLIDDASVCFKMTLPGGTVVEVYTKNENSTAQELGYAYIPEYDQESADMYAEDLGAWADETLDSCRRVDAYFESMKNSSIELNSALEPDVAARVKAVFRAAQSAVDLPPGFRYTSFRENKGDNLILSTLMYTSPKLGATQWVAKSSLTVDTEAEGVDDWAFEPNYNPNSEGHLIYHRQGRFIDVEQGMYGFTSEGDSEDKRDRKAAYWLAGLLSDMVDSMLQNPPARCYEYFLADGIAELKKSDLDRMSTPGIMRLVTKGYVDPEKVLKAKPELAKDLVEKKLIAPEIVARRAPERLLWLVQRGLISPDYAVKIDPNIKEKLARKGMYSVAENVPDDPAEILEGVKAGTIQPIDAYRKNAKLLQPMVEQQLITPQEAYKLDASIVTWLLINHYIGKAEAMRVKPDVQKYIARKYKDVNWDELDAAKDGLNSSRKAPETKLNSSSGFNSDSSEGKTAASGQIAEEGQFSEYGPGYEKLSDTAVAGPGYVAEVMLPEDDFDGIVVPGDSEEIAKETLMQMLLANDGTFIDWKPIPCIQTFKSENPEGNFLVLN